MECQAPGGLRRLGAERPRVTGAAVLLAKAPLDVSPTCGIDSRCPAGGGFSLRTMHLLTLPIGHEVSQRLRPLNGRLPVRIRARRATQRDAIILLAADEQLRINIGRIDHMLARRQVFPH